MAKKTFSKTDAVVSECIVGLLGNDSWRMSSCCLTKAIRLLVSATGGRMPDLSECFDA